jgi:CheY-like chemotaxis protein
MNKLILVGEDDTALLSLLERHIVSLGYHVVSVTDGVEASLKTQELRPDLVLLDIQMPGAYGSTVYETLRQDPRTADIPVIFMSGSLSEELFRKRVPATGRTRFLKKPFDMKTLGDTIKELLGTKA